MKLTKAILIAAATSLVAGSALAQEPSYLGGKGRYNRYVPAPAPVPETFAWYVRLDLGVGTTSGDASDRGTYGNGPGPGSEFWAATPQQISWFDSNSDSFFQGGIGFGRYLSPRFRMDATLDFKTAEGFGGSGAFVYDQVSAPGFVPTGEVVAVVGTDRIDVIDGVGLINAYFDLVPRGSLTPYIGVGAGFAARFIDRSHDAIEAVSGAGATRLWSGEGKETKFAPAFSATVGLAWAITPGTMLDINYRYTYIGAVDASIIVASDFSAQHSKITINESHQHAIRAGLRWNIW